MDAAGVDVQVISPSPSQYHYWAEPDLARVVCSTANRGVAAVVAEEPEPLHRLRAGSAAAPGAVRRAARRRGADLRPGRCGDLLPRADSRRHCRTGRRTPRTVLGPSRRTRRGRVPASLRLHPGRAAGPATTCPTRSGSRSRTPSRSRISSSPACWIGIPVCGCSPLTAAATCRPSSAAATTPGRSARRLAAACSHRAATCAGSGSTPWCTPRTRCGHWYRQSAPTGSCSARTTPSTWA